MKNQKHLPLQPYADPAGACIIIKNRRAVYVKTRKLIRANTRLYMYKRRKRQPTGPIKKNTKGEGRWIRTKTWNRRKIKKLPKATKRKKTNEAVNQKQEDEERKRKKLKFTPHENEEKRIWKSLRRNEENANLRVKFNMEENIQEAKQTKLYVDASWSVRREEKQNNSRRKNTRESYIFLRRTAFTRWWKVMNVNGYSGE